MPVKSDAAALCRRLAGWISFLSAARRAFGVTRSDVARQHAVQPCNLSAFVASKGTTRNVSLEKLVLIAHTLGVNQDGTLTPGMHRWDLLGSRSMESGNALGELLDANAAQDPRRPARCMTWRNGSTGFLVHRPARGCAVLARLTQSQIKRLRDRPQAAVVFEKITSGEASELQTLLMADEPEWVISRVVDTYLDQTMAPPQHAAAR